MTMLQPQHDATAMTSDSDNSGLFAELLASIQGFREAVEGEPGRQVASMGADPGVLPDIVRAVIRSLHSTLMWLSKTITDIESPVRAGNAAIALLETGEETLDMLADGFVLPGLQSVLGSSANVIEEIDSALSAAQGVLGDIRTLAASILPPVEHVFALLDEMDALLGPGAGSGGSSPGSLDTLMKQIWV